MKVICFLIALIFYIEFCRGNPIAFRTGVLLHEEISSKLQKLLWDSGKTSPLVVQSRILDDAPPLPEESGGQWSIAEEVVDSTSSVNNQDVSNSQIGKETDAESLPRKNDTELSTTKEDSKRNSSESQMLAGLLVKHFNNGIFKVRVEPEEDGSSQITSPEMPITTELPVPVVNSLYSRSLEGKSVDQEPIFQELPNDVVAEDSQFNTLPSISQADGPVSSTNAPVVSSPVISSVSLSNQTSNTALDNPESSTASHTTSTEEYVKIQFPGEPQKEISISQYPGKVTETVEMLHSEQKPKLDEDYKYETEFFNQEFVDPSGDLETDGTENIKVIEEYEKPVEETTEVSNTKNNFEVPYPGEVAEEVKEIGTESESDVKGENEFGVEDERLLESVGEGEEVDNVEEENQTDIKEDVEQIGNDGTKGEAEERATTDKNEPLEIETESLAIENDDTPLTLEYELDLSASENDFTYQVPETESIPLVPENEGESYTHENEDVSQTPENEDAPVVPENEGVSQTLENEGESYTPENEDVSQTPENEGAPVVPENEGVSYTPDDEGVFQTLEDEGAPLVLENKGVSYTPENEGESYTPENVRKSSDFRKRDKSKLDSDIRDIITGNYVRDATAENAEGVDKTTSSIINHMWRGRTKGESFYFRDAVRILLEKVQEEMEIFKPFSYQDSEGVSYSFEGLGLYEVKGVDILNIKSRNRKIIEAEFTIGPFLVGPSEESSSSSSQELKIDGSMEIRIRKKDEDYTVYLQRLNLKKPVSTQPEIMEDLEQYIAFTEITEKFVNSNFKNLLEDKIHKLLERNDFYYLFSSFYRI